MVLEKNIYFALHFVLCGLSPRKQSGNLFDRIQLHIPGVVIIIIIPKKPGIDQGIMIAPRNPSVIFQACLLARFPPSKLALRERLKKAREIFIGYLEHRNEVGITDQL